MRWRLWLGSDGMTMGTVRAAGAAAWTETSSTPMRRVNDVSISAAARSALFIRRFAATGELPASTK